MVESKKPEQLIEVWEDVVDLGQMAKAFLISVVCTMGLYFIAPAGNRPIQLLLGLGGAVLGFVINAILFKPKRKIVIEDKYDNN